MHQATETTNHQTNQNQPNQPKPTKQASIQWATEPIVKRQLSFGAN